MIIVVAIAPGSPHDELVAAIQAVGLPPDTTAVLVTEPDPLHEYLRGSELCVVFLERALGLYYGAVTTVADIRREHPSQKVFILDPNYPENTPEGVQILDTNGADGAGLARLIIDTATREAHA